MLIPAEDKNKKKQAGQNNSKHYTMQNLLVSKWALQKKELCMQHIMQMARTQGWLASASGPASVRYASVRWVSSALTEYVVCLPFRW